MKLGYQTAKDAENFLHLLYMDDLKLYGKSEIETQSLTNTVWVFSTDISMQFGMGKCATLSIKRGKITTCDGIEMPNRQLIKYNQNEDYKYLGILQLDNIKHGEVKTIVRREYTNRVRKILKSK
uniref:Uncharacterized protein n=1 Tax=Micrurus carvalhoi TaxID=3147026 RepID=A0A2H6MYK7_9SAUR